MQPIDSNHFVSLWCSEQLSLAVLLTHCRIALSVTPQSTRSTFPPRHPSSCFPCFDVNISTADVPDSSQSSIRLNHSFILLS